MAARRGLNECVWRVIRFTLRLDEFHSQLALVYPFGTQLYKQGYADISTASCEIELVYSSLVSEKRIIRITCESA